MWEQEPMQRLAHEKQLSAYKHDGFWQNMDTLRDKMYLEDLWASGKAPWKVWDTPVKQRSEAGSVTTLFGIPAST